MITGNPAIGDCFWCIAPSIESESYGSVEPIRPWRGRITYENTGTYTLSYVRENGEVNEDSNTTAYVTKEDLFASQKEAQEAYWIACGEQAQLLLAQAKQWVETMIQSMRYDHP